MVVLQPGDSLHWKLIRARLARCRVGSLCLRAQFGHGKPVVLVWCVGDPWWQRHAKMIAQHLRIALVERTHFAQPLKRMAVAANAYAALAKRFVKLLIARGRKPVLSVGGR